MLINALYNIYMYGTQMLKYRSLNNFKYIIANEENVKLIDDYIIKKEEEGNIVYILDARAPLYMIPLNKYNKDFDMLLNGNLGSRRRRWFNSEA